ncbi:hypothetical protein J6590_012226 [Homalodisca vitripennis]|nr:hypothetical protein J6590_012226 [Homalodisca vitripennis]
MPIFWFADHSNRARAGNMGTKQKCVERTAQVAVYKANSACPCTGYHSFVKKECKLLDTLLIRLLLWSDKYNLTKVKFLISTEALATWEKSLVEAFCRDFLSLRLNIFGGRISPEDITQRSGPAPGRPGLFQNPIGPLRRFDLRRQLRNQNRPRGRKQGHGHWLKAHLTPSTELRAINTPSTTPALRSCRSCAVHARGLSYHRNVPALFAVNGTPRAPREISPAPKRRPYTFLRPRRLCPAVTMFGLSTFVKVTNGTGALLFCRCRRKSAVFYRSGPRRRTFHKMWQ